MQLKDALPAIANLLENNLIHSKPRLELKNIAQTPMQLVWRYYDVSDFIVQHHYVSLPSFHLTTSLGICVVKLSLDFFKNVTDLDGTDLSQLGFSSNQVYRSASGFASSFKSHHSQVWLNFLLEPLKPYLGQWLGLPIHHINLQSTKVKQVSAAQTNARFTLQQTTLVSIENLTNAADPAQPCLYIHDCSDQLYDFFTQRYSSLSCTNSEAIYELPVYLRLQFGTSHIDYGKIKQLQLNDLLTIDRWFSTGSVLQLKVLMQHGNFAWLANLQGSHATVIESFSNMDTPHSRDNSMQETQTFDHLPIDLSFELPAQSISLAALKTVEAGYTFDLGVGIEESVIEIKANGQTIAQGHLVAIGEQLGVRITAINI